MTEQMEEYLHEIFVKPPENVELTNEKCNAIASKVVTRAMLKLVLELDKQAKTNEVGTYILGLFADSEFDWSILDPKNVKDDLGNDMKKQFDHMVTMLYMFYRIPMPATLVGPFQLEKKNFPALIPKAFQNSPRMMLLKGEIERAKKFLHLLSPTPLLRISNLPQLEAQIPSWFRKKFRAPKKNKEERETDGEQEEAEEGEGEEGEGEGEGEGEAEGAEGGIFVKLSGVKLEKRVKEGATYPEVGKTISLIYSKNKSTKYYMAVSKQFLQHLIDVDDDSLVEFNKTMANVQAASMADKIKTERPANKERKPH